MVYRPESVPARPAARPHSTGRRTDARASPRLSAVDPVSHLESASDPVCSLPAVPEEVQPTGLPGQPASGYPQQLSIASTSGRQGTDAPGAAVLLDSVPPATASGSGSAVQSAGVQAVPAAAIELQSTDTKIVQALASFAATGRLPPAFDTQDAADTLLASLSGGAGSEHGRGELLTAVLSRVWSSADGALGRDDVIELGLDLLGAPWVPWWPPASAELWH